MLEETIEASLTLRLNNKRIVKIKEFRSMRLSLILQKIQEKLLIFR
ncbi:hypothetical protein BTU51_0149 [Rickettsia rickettsii]|uniref:Uncharacterized protein n=1 Tax=Rickettsia rickettsii (strain Iowa) TaxID=452659 RepID=B0BW42_RICRO|nr:hypothetical protein RrIowa_0149 [Rickettsia rickettsii str. Iowa]AFB23053.1 hypothetical protein RPL_00670 [Rickettsia rickettsii str. Colombia]APU55020.1 hypothetical protein BTU50_0149 [Rickettsia rickettsii]APU56397.1 hypothetical protein BTU51_0149 [Rickettsia rickettsii]